MEAIEYKARVLPDGHLSLPDKIKSRLDINQEIRVLVLVDEKQISSIWDEIKADIAKRHPELISQTKEEAKEEFERLSKKIAQNMRFENWKEAERFMRGNDYGLARY